MQIVDEMTQKHVDFRQCFNLGNLVDCRSNLVRPKCRFAMQIVDEMTQKHVDCRQCFNLGNLVDRRSNMELFADMLPRFWS